MVTLNQAVAVAMVHGAEAGLAAARPAGRRPAAGRAPSSRCGTRAPARDGRQRCRGTSGVPRRGAPDDEPARAPLPRRAGRAAWREPAPGVVITSCRRRVAPESRVARSIGRLVTLRGSAVRSELVRVTPADQLRSEARTAAARWRLGRRVLEPPGHRRAGTGGRRSRTARRRGVVVGAAGRIAHLAAAHVRGVRRSRRRASRGLQRVVPLVRLSLQGGRCDCLGLADPCRPSRRGSRRLLRERVRHARAAQRAHAAKATFVPRSCSRRKRSRSGARSETPTSSRWQR